MGILRSLDLFLRTEKMASCNFRRGLILFNLKKLTAISQNNAAFSTTARILGGHGPVSKYELHGGEKVHTPQGCAIGTREVVGYGNCGQENYVDHVHYPFPAIRFKEDNAEIAQIRKKGLGDWKKITVHEKKVLYRASYCQTFAEMNAPTGEWKMITGMILIALGVQCGWSFGVKNTLFLEDSVPSSPITSRLTFNAELIMKWDLLKVWLQNTTTRRTNGRNKL